MDVAAVQLRWSLLNIYEIQIIWEEFLQDRKFYLQMYQQTEL